MSGTTLGGVECDHCGHQEPGADGIPIRSQHTSREIHGDFFLGDSNKNHRSSIFMYFFAIMLHVLLFKFDRLVQLP